MNQKDNSVHFVADVKNLIIDGFKIAPQLSKTFYFLSHFHSDHYTGLNERWDNGVIICSSITSALIKQELNVTKPEIMIINPGEELIIKIKEIKIKINAMDANHCPGALLLLFEFLNDNNNHNNNHNDNHNNSNTNSSSSSTTTTTTTNNIHLHCGDMRYSSKFKSYPALLNGKIKIAKLYLDTTYAHARHDFIPQDEAIQRIVTLCKSFINKEKEGIICLQAYTIGKERLITAVSQALNMPAYVDSRKFNIIKQLGPPYSKSVGGEVNSSLFTDDMNSTRIHVCKMGFGGEMWPYFIPDFDSPQKYINKLEKNGFNLHRSNGGAKKALVVIPTGWATATNYNSKNAVSVKENVSIHLIPYSEHSNFEELKEFVKFLKPRQVVPTVFKDENQRRAIHKLFHGLVDHTSAKRNFLSFFNSSSSHFKPKTPSNSDSSSNNSSSTCSLPTSSSSSSSSSRGTPSKSESELKQEQEERDKSEPKQIVQEPKRSKTVNFSKNTSSNTMKKEMSEFYKSALTASNTIDLT